MKENEDKLEKEWEIHMLYMDFISNFKDFKSSSEFIFNKDQLIIKESLHNLHLKLEDICGLGFFGGGGVWFF